MSWIVLTGDSAEQLRALPDASIDAVVTDPPYGLSKEPDALEVLRHWLNGDDYEHRGGGFMGKRWDSFVPGPALWREVLRVLKPGGHACVFAGSRTVDLTGLSLRIAGFEIRDQLQWLYATGFPKSLNVSKAIDKAAGAEREVVGTYKSQLPGGTTYAQDAWSLSHRGADSARGSVTAPATDDAKRWEGYGTALKPAHEPIVLARKPLSGTVAATVLEHGTGALNIGGCRIGSESTARNNKAEMGYHGGNTAQEYSTGSDAGRWPANVILDPEAGALLDEQSAGASRFFYCAKTSRTEREAGLEHMRKASAGELTGGRAEGSDGLKNPRAGAGRTSSGRANVHPTVKPIELMRWLVRLVTPPGGRVLDPFTGSGSTGCAAVLEGAAFVGVELSPEYVEIAKARIRHWHPGE